MASYGSNTTVSPWLADFEWQSNRTAQPRRAHLHRYGSAVGAIRASEAEVHEMMNGVPGFRAWSLVDTSSGA
jgi:hypothetical protein